MFILRLAEKAYYSKMLLEKKREYQRNMGDFEYCVR